MISDWFKMLTTNYSFTNNIYIRGAHDKFPDFFRMGTFIDTLVPIEVISSGCNALVVPFQKLL